VLKTMMITFLSVILVLINITSGGLPIVNMNVTLQKPAYIINISLPVACIDRMIYIRDLCTGTSLPYRLINSTYMQVINIENCSRIEITYVAEPTITNESIGVIVYARQYYDNVRLIWARNIVIVPSLQDLQKMRFSRSNMAILEPGHKYYIRYIILLPLTENKSRPSINVRESETKKNVNKALLYIALIFLVVIDIVVWPIVMLRRGRKISLKHRGDEKEKVEDLSDLEREILRIIRERGGEILQSELYRELGVPRTTLWRAVKRLEERGLVRVEKINRLNKIVLLRDQET